MGSITDYKSSLITERAIDSARPIKVIYIGAGVSGIVTAIRLPEKVSNLDLTIYDKNPEIGGTWWENRYPGCACGKHSLYCCWKNIADEAIADIPAHVYQLSFESNPEWSSFYASGPEILEYWKKVVEKYGVRKYMKLGHKAVEARWDDQQKKWRVKFQVAETGEIVEDVGDVLMTGIGALNEWKWPDIPGLHDFKGELMHSATWDDNFDYKVSWEDNDNLNCTPLTGEIGEASCRHRSGIEWDSNCSIYPTARVSIRSLRPRSHLDCNYNCWRGGSKTQSKRLQLQLYC